MSQFYNPVRLYLGTESVEGLIQWIHARYPQASRILLLTRGSQVERSEGLLPLMGALQGKSILIHELRLANPDITDIIRLRQEIGAFDFQLVIAIGGGSVMDMAKAVIALQGIQADKAPDVRDIMVHQQYCRLEQTTPWIAISTTSGTGSEATCWATVWDKEGGSKYSIADERLYAQAAVMLPELTAMLPLKLSAVTALDALCHAVEAYWAIRTNPVTRMYSLQAIRMIRKFLPRLKEDPANLHVRSHLALASLYAGLAFSNTRTTACHSISYPLTLLHGIEHGVAASFTLGAVLKLNQPALVEPERLLNAFGVDRPEAVHQVIVQLYELYDIPSRLGDYGVTSRNVGDIAARAYTKGRMDNNPVAITRQKVEQMLLELI